MILRFWCYVRFYQSIREAGRQRAGRRSLAVVASSAVRCLHRADRESYRRATEAGVQKRKNTMLLYMPLQWDGPVMPASLFKPKHQRDEPDER